MKIRFKITRKLLSHMRADLSRSHDFALERVGFLMCRFSVAPRVGLLILGHSYHFVSDDDYIDDDRYGAVVNSHAFRGALQVSLRQNVGIFHAHLHPHDGVPSPSRIDLVETAKFVPDFFHVRPLLPHGAIILSNDSLSARAWLPPSRVAVPVASATVVGTPLITSSARA